MKEKRISTILSNKKRQRQWREGFHTDAGGKECDLVEMTPAHLNRTIKMFKTQHLDTGPLERERRRRAVAAKADAIETVLALLKSAARLEPNVKQRVRARKADKLLSKYVDEA